MKKSTIWILAILMGLTFMGLLYVQISYMKNMIRMREDQFSEGVKRSLYAVTTMLEQDETRHFLEEDVAKTGSSLIFTQYNDENLPQQTGIRYSFKTTSGVEADLMIKGDAEKTCRC